MANEQQLEEMREKQKKEMDQILDKRVKELSQITDDQKPIDSILRKWDPTNTAINALADKIDSNEFDFSKAKTQITNFTAEIESIKTDKLKTWQAEHDKLISKVDKLFIGLDELPADKGLGAETVLSEKRNTLETDLNIAKVAIQARYDEVENLLAALPGLQVHLRKLKSKVQDPKKAHRKKIKQEITAKKDVLLEKMKVDKESAEKKSEEAKNLNTLQATQAKVQTYISEINSSLESDLKDFNFENTATTIKAHAETLQKVDDALIAVFVGSHLRSIESMGF